MRSSSKDLLLIEKIQPIALLLLGFGGKYIRFDASNDFKCMGFLLPIHTSNGSLTADRNGILGFGILNQDSNELIEIELFGWN